MTKNNQESVEETLKNGFDVNQLPENTEIRALRLTTEQMEQLTNDPTIANDEQFLEAAMKIGVEVDPKEAPGYQEMVDSMFGSNDQASDMSEEAQPDDFEEGHYGPGRNFADFMKDLLVDVIKDSKENCDRCNAEIDQARKAKEGPLPEWAAYFADNDWIEVATQLSTRDGRVCSNATIGEIQYNIGTGQPRFLVVTDASNVMCLTLQELQDMFYPPVYVGRAFPSGNKSLDALIEWQMDHGNYGNN